MLSRDLKWQSDWQKYKNNVNDDYKRRQGRGEDEVEDEGKERVQGPRIRHSFPDLTCAPLSSPDFRLADFVSIPLVVKTPGSFLCRRLTCCSETQSGTTWPPHLSSWPSFRGLLTMADRGSCARECGKKPRRGNHGQLPIRQYAKCGRFSARGLPWMKRGKKGTNEVTPLRRLRILFCYEHTAYMYTLDPLGLEAGSGSADQCEREPRTCKGRSWGLYRDDPPFRSNTLCEPLYDAQRPPLTMSDDGNWIPTAWLTAPPFTFPLSTPQETPTDFPASTPSEPRTSLEISPPTLTKTEDPTRTGVLLSTFGTLATISPTYGSPTSFPLSVWSPITIHSSPLSSPRPTHTTHTRHTYSPRTSSTSSGSSLITSGSSFKTSSLSSTSSHSPSMTSSTTFSRTSTSFPPPVTQTTLPSFGSSSDVRIFPYPVQDSSPDTMEHI